MTVQYIVGQNLVHKILNYVLLVRYNITGVYV